jgi:cytochrome c
MRLAILRALTPSLSLAAMVSVAQADTEADQGKLAFNNNCRTCHSMDAGDHRLGPSLHGVVGREAGSIEGYPFSSAMERADFVWDEQRLDKFITNPSQVLTGHKMKPYGGMDDANERQKIIAFLKTLN